MLITFAAWMLAAPSLAFESVTVDDGVEGCDADSILDAGEYGRILVTLRNTGDVALTGVRAQITPASPGLFLPVLNDIIFAPLVVGATGSASAMLVLSPGLSGIQQLDFGIDYTATELAVPLSVNASVRANVDEIAAASQTDTVEGRTSPEPWSVSTLGWQRAELTPLQHAWRVGPGVSGAAIHDLTSPVFTQDGSGSMNVQFDHSWAYGTLHSGGVVEMRVNGGAWTDVGGPAYNGTVSSAFGSARPGFIGTSGATHSSITQAIAPGSTVQIRFRAGIATVETSALWQLDNIAFTGVVETPFTVIVSDSFCQSVPSSTDLAITVDDGVVATTGGQTVTYTIVARHLGAGTMYGATVSAAFSSALTCTWTCRPGPGDTCTPAGAGNISDLVTLRAPGGGHLIYTATCAVGDSVSGTTVVNAAIDAPAFTNEVSATNNTAQDSNTLVSRPASLWAATAVTGAFVPSGVVTYTMTIGNDGPGTQFDNAGDELTDTLPASLTLISASASTGTAIATIGTNTVIWNGVVRTGEPVTLTIDAVINGNAAPGTSVSNQANISYDATGDGTNDASTVSDSFICE